MAGPERFSVFVAVSFLVFVAVLSFVLRKRSPLPWPVVLALALVVVVGGMLFARWGQNSGLPWWIYYAVPAVATLLLPPVALRMSRREVATYLPLALLMAPVIHMFFAFVFGWPEYMPFIPVPSLSNVHGDR
jgi:hypothetical protein